MSSSWSGAGHTVIMRAARKGEALVETARILDGSPRRDLPGSSCARTKSSRRDRRLPQCPIRCARGRGNRRGPQSLREQDGAPGCGHRSSQDRVHKCGALRGSQLVARRPRPAVQPGGTDLHACAGFVQAARAGHGQRHANNNDHGISFDGKWLALSSHTEQPGRKPGSQIYVVAVGGGQPVKVTDEAPSYWHGWSPDGRP